MIEFTRKHILKTQKNKVGNQQQKDIWEIKKYLAVK